jgi:3-oxoacyl-[acyl-carrier protein] reductase
MGLISPKEIARAYVMELDNAQ